MLISLFARKPDKLAIDSETIFNVHFPSLTLFPKLFFFSNLEKHTILKMVG